MARIDPSVRKLLRTYIVDHGYNMRYACKKLGISEATGRKYKRQAEAAGDHWRPVAAAGILSRDQMRQRQEAILEKYTELFDSILSKVSTSEMSLPQQIEVMNSLADNNAKMASAMRRLAPDISELAVAISVVKMLAKYVRESHPQHAPVILELLEPFGHLISREFGER